jgi:hypothetical protein
MPASSVAVEALPVAPTTFLWISTPDSPVAYIRKGRETSIGITISHGGTRCNICYISVKTAPPLRWTYPPVPVSRTVTRCVSKAPETEATPPPTDESAPLGWPVPR